MPQPFIDALVELISSVIAYEMGSQSFYIVIAACALTWIILARILMGMMKSEKGFIAAIFALLVPLSLGLLAYGLAAWQAVPLIDADWAEQYLPLGIFGLILVLSILITAKRIMALSGVLSVIVFVFASAASVGAYYGVGIALETLEFGGDQIKQRDEKSKKELDSLL